MTSVLSVCECVCGCVGVVIVDMTSKGTLESWIHTFSRGCLSHMNNTSAESLIRSFHNSSQPCRGFRWEVVQQTEARRNVLISAVKIHIYWASTLITKTSLNIFPSDFYPEIFGFVIFYFLLRVSEVKRPPQFFVCSEFMIPLFYLVIKKAENSFLNRCCFVKPVY